MQRQDGGSHMMSQGNGGEAIYHTDEDRRRFLGLVAEWPARLGAQVYGSWRRPRPGSRANAFKEGAEAVGCVSSGRR